MTAHHWGPQVSGQRAERRSKCGPFSADVVHLVVDELLKMFSTKGFLVSGYSDDVVIIARGRFLSISRDRTYYALHVLDKTRRPGNTRLERDLIYAFPKVKNESISASTVILCIRTALGIKYTAIYWSSEILREKVWHWVTLLLYNDT